MKTGNICHPSSIFLSSINFLIIAMLLYVVMLQEASNTVKPQSMMNFSDLALFLFSISDTAMEVGVVPKVGGARWGCESSGITLLSAAPPKSCKPPNLTARKVGTRTRWWGDHSPEWF